MIVLMLAIYIVITAVGCALFYKNGKVKALIDVCNIVNEAILDTDTNDPDSDGRLDALGEIIEGIKGIK